MTGTRGDHLACSDLEDYVAGRQAREHDADTAEEQPVSDYGMTVTTSLPMDEAENSIRSALAEEGFGVLTEIDVAATLKAKIDVDRPAYKILGACNPMLANQALQHDESIGLLLPCNVTLSATEAGTVVAAVDPKVMLGIAGESPEMMQLAGEAREKLQRAIDTLPAAS
jgi:uncharacterized protein (DUF302 family)